MPTNKLLFIPNSIVCAVDLVNIALQQMQTRNDTNRIGMDSNKDKTCALNISTDLNMEMSDIFKYF